MNRDEHDRRCTFLLASGDRCRSYAVRATYPPLCWQHTLSPEQRKAHSVQWQKLSAEALKERKAGHTRKRVTEKPTVQVSPVVTYDEPRQAEYRVGRVGDREIRRLRVLAQIEKYTEQNVNYRKEQR